MPVITTEKAPEKHLYDNEILKNIGIDDSFSTTRVLVFRGGTGAVSHPEGTLLLVNIEDILNNYQELGGYFERLAAEVIRMAKARSKTSPQSHKKNDLDI